MKFPRPRRVKSRVTDYLLAVGMMCVAVAVLALVRERLNQTTAAIVLLLVVLLTATLRGSRPAMLSSVLGAMGLNFFFLPPFGTLLITDPQNWVALAAFIITAVTVGWLSASVKLRAEEAEARQAEIERLYEESQASFQLASQAEALKQSERLKSALLDAVTHDLRTPLTSIKASITTLLDETRQQDDGPAMMLDDEARQEMMEVIDEECDRLNRFIGGLIDLARIEAGEMHLRRRWGTVDEIITAALARAAALTHAHRIQVVIEKEFPVVRVDPRAISEVVYTLIDNAAKYSPPETNICLTARRAGDHMLHISVEDEGAGVPHALRERVFDKFFRATRDGDISTHQPTGTGMGLAIAKGIVEAHGGSIWIEDGAGARGTRLVFTLPIGEDEDMNPPPTRESSFPEAIKAD